MGLVVSEWILSRVAKAIRDTKGVPPRTIFVSRQVWDDLACMNGDEPLTEFNGVKIAEKKDLQGSQFELLYGPLT